LSVCPVARGDVDLVHLVPVSVCLAENRAMAAFGGDPGNRERVLLGAAAEGEGQRIAHRDPRWQIYVLISLAGAGHHPIATLGQHTRASRLYRLDGTGLRRSRSAETKNGQQETLDPDTRWHQPSPIEHDMLNLRPPSRRFNQARKPR
jgi:hypothetical protein